jgi:hypothetical protein
MTDRPDEQPGTQPDAQPDGAWAGPDGAAAGTPLHELPPPAPGTAPWGAPAAQPQGDPFPDGYPMIPQHPQWGERPSSTRKWTIAAGVLLAILSVSAVALMAWRGISSALGSDAPAGAGDVVSVGDLAVGDCFRMGDGQTVSDVKVVACDQPHDAQVYAVVPLGLSGPYPGTDAVSAAADEACQAAQSVLSDDVYDAVGVYPGVFYPLEQNWDADDRTAQCTVETDTEDGLTRSYLA